MSVIKVKYSKHAFCCVVCKELHIFWIEMFLLQCCNFSNFTLLRTVKELEIKKAKSILGASIVSWHYYLGTTY